jgi:8-oxo-dGTP pyrophosphatase MutT (NUDIX family)
MTQAAVPSKASTIILVRPGSAAGFEVLLTRRPEEMLFLGGYWVFPGGAVEEQDWSEKMLSRCRGLSASEAQAILSGEMEPEIALGHWVAAVRELFEETGIHFFINPNEVPSVAKADDSLSRVGEKRKELSARRIDLPELLQTERLFCDLSGMTYLFHRVTPEKYQLRFDTRFYLAVLPENQRALTSSEEVAETLWITPEAALERSKSDHFPMLPPTVTALQRLAEHACWQELRTAFRLA